MLLGIPEALSLGESISGNLTINKTVSRFGCFQYCPDRLFLWKGLKMDITNYVKAGYPGIVVNTQEPYRAIKSIKAEGWETYAWDCLQGVTHRATSRIIEDVIDPLGALNWLTERSESVLIVQNFHHFLGSVEVIQAIQNNIHIYKGQGACLVMAGPHFILPQEIEKYFTILDFALPSNNDLISLMEELGKAVNIEVNPDAVEAAQGLTEFEAETAFALSLVQNRSFDPEVITAQKKMMIRRSGLMEFFPPVPIDQVGGLEPFKAYLNNRIRAFEPGNDHLPKPKALLLVGIPGTGKSLSCKAAASILNWPLIRLDISALKGSLVGESEMKMRLATATIDAFGKAVVWLDEIEKVFSGIKASGDSDGGTIFRDVRNLSDLASRDKFSYTSYGDGQRHIEVAPGIHESGQVRFDVLRGYTDRG